VNCHGGKSRERENKIPVILMVAGLGGLSFHAATLRERTLRKREAGNFLRGRQNFLHLPLRLRCEE
jgi:hypothetical protein